MMFLQQLALSVVATKRGDLLHLVDLISSNMAKALIKAQEGFQIFHDNVIPA